MTGNLGDVMKESATIAYEYLKAHAKEYGIQAKTFETQNPRSRAGRCHAQRRSIGRHHPAYRYDFGLYRQESPQQDCHDGRNHPTRKTSSRGRHQGKILAAKRSGIFDIVLSSENKKDIDDIKENFIEGMNFHYFSAMKDALNYTIL